MKAGEASTADSSPDSTAGFIVKCRSLLLAAALGAATVAGFAPFDFYFVPWLTLAALIWLWRRAASPKTAAYTGFAFGGGLFGAGVSWVYVSLHDFGGMPAPVAVPATALLCAFLAFFPAVAGWCAARWGGTSKWNFIAVTAATWTVAEWARGWLLTGFPWLAIGSSQVASSPLAQFAPLAGVYGISFVLMLLAELLAEFAASLRTAPRQAALLLLPVAALLGLGPLAGLTQWTTKVGDPVTVTLLQGNIPQDLKFRDDFMPRTLRTYVDLTLASRSRLTILPESALPLFRHEVPEDLLRLFAEHGRSNGGDVLAGMFDLDRDSGAIYNTMFSFGSAPTQTYRKHHLVPFGEFIPLKSLIGWVYDSILHMPLADQARGPRVQEPMNVAGQRVAMDICYEDAFGEEIIRQLPQATLLVNVSNDAWFGDYVAPWQHTQIAQTRALETGRWMLRATNTGITSIIDDRGVVVAHKPPQQAASLSGITQGRSGATPYVRFGNAPVIALCLLIFAGAAWARRRAGATPPS